MKLDCHIHITDGSPDPQKLLSRLAAAGLDGGVVLSLPPASFSHLASPRPSSERLVNLMAWTGDNQNLFPFFWIDPTEEDAGEQVRHALDAGVMGFKVICNRFFPGDERALPVFRLIAVGRKPILFHSGILWDGTNSSQYNRPAGFEALMEVQGLVFALAHISWPWTDELIAVYGKFLSARRLRGGRTAEMFIDTTPGTPPIYRRETLTRLFTVGYDVGKNVFFGSDGETSSYNEKSTREWIDRDSAIFSDLGVDEQTVAAVFGGNLIRFLGTE